MPTTVAELYKYRSPKPISVQTLSVFSPYSTMHEDIADIVEDRHTALILLPFHKQKTVDGGMEVREERRERERVGGRFHMASLPHCPSEPDAMNIDATARLPETAEHKQTEVGNESLTGHIISTTIGGKMVKPNRQSVTWRSVWWELARSASSFKPPVAIKKVLQDKRYKNRELQLMRSMDHPNVISLKHCFFSTTSQDELFLNLVMEYVPETMYRVLKHYNNVKQQMPLVYVKLYMYQIFRGLAYIHTVPGVSSRCEAAKSFGRPSYAPSEAL